jgi:hypothetical protein
MLLKAISFSMQSEIHSVCIYVPVSGSFVSEAQHNDGLGVPENTYD